MNEIFKYIIVVNHTQVLRAETFRDAFSLHEAALKQGDISQIYQLVIDGSQAVYRKEQARDMRLS